MPNMIDPKTQNPDLQRKGYEADIKEIDRKEESVTAYVSTISKDSYDEVVIPRFDFERFNKNPVVPWSHNYQIPPVGRALWAKQDKFGLIGKTKFATSTDLGRDVWNLYEGGFLRAFSIGYVPGVRIHEGDQAWNELLEQYEFDNTAREAHDHNKIWEWSPVTLPANEDAVVNALRDGAVKSAELHDFVQKHFKQKVESLSNDKSEAHDDGEKVSSNEVIKLLKSINEKLDKVVNLDEKLTLYQDALTIERELKEPKPAPVEAPEAVVGINGLKELIPQIVSGVIRQTKGQV